MGCMLYQLINTAHLFDCSNCPIRKYNCCQTNQSDYEELAYRLELDIQKLEVLRKKVVDKMEQ